MKATLEKISTSDFQETVDNILSLYNEQTYCVVNFIYFSQIVSQQVFKSPKKKTDTKKEYKKLILKSDFLLPDWIALQTFYYFANFFRAIKSDRKRLPNVNWTDFTPFFLQDIKQRFWNQKINLILYWSTPAIAEKVWEFYKKKWYNVIYIQDGFSELSRENVEKILEEYQDTLNILLVARSTPKIPIQELWTSRNYQKIQENKLLVMNVWGLFDFIGWVQKRAPKIIRKLKLEWFWRLCSQPKRNYKKVINSLMLFPYIFHYLILKKD